jgi:hypothetical protein
MAAPITFASIVLIWMKVVHIRETHDI